MCIASATMDMSGSHDYERQSAPESTWLCIKLYCNPSRTIYQQRWCSTRGGRWDREDATKEVLWPETNCFCVSTRWKKQDSRGPGEKVYQIKSITVADIIFNGYLRYTCLIPQHSLWGTYGSSNCLFFAFELPFLLFHHLSNQYPRSGSARPSPIPSWFYPEVAPRIRLYQRLQRHPSPTPPPSFYQPVSTPGSLFWIHL